MGDRTPPVFFAGNGRIDCVAPMTISMHPNSVGKTLADDIADRPDGFGRDWNGINSKGSFRLTPWAEEDLAERIFRSEPN